MAQTMRISSTTELKGAARLAPQRPAAAVAPVRPLRVQSWQVAQASAAWGPSPRVQRSSHVVCVAAQEAPTQQASGTKEWYALVANAEFYCNDVQNEPLAEQLRERVRYFQEQNRPIDFYMVPNPTWLDTKFPEQAKQVRRPCVALVSTDKQWMTFMKLRLDRVLKVDLKDMTEAEVLSMGEDLPEFKKPEKWTAPYSMYAPGWWTKFYPSKQ